MISSQSEKLILLSQERDNRKETINHKFRKSYSVGLVKCKEKEIK